MVITYDQIHLTRESCDGDVRRSATSEEVGHCPHIQLAAMLIISIKLDIYVSSKESLF